MYFKDIKMAFIVGFIVLGFCILGIMAKLESNGKIVENDSEVKQEEVVTEVQEEKSVEETTEIQVDYDEPEKAYEYLKPQLEELYSNLDYTFEIVDDKLYMVGYISEEELTNSFKDGSWEKQVEQLKAVTESITKDLISEGYTTVDFHFAFCDKLERTDKCYLMVRNGRVVYDTKEERGI